MQVSESKTKFSSPELSLYLTPYFRGKKSIYKYNYDHDILGLEGDVS
jgi:hypothetical protein